MLKSVLAAALVAGTALTAAAPAQAADGCGRGGHRGPYGHCRPNYAPGYARAPGVSLVIGNYYHGRGYWDGRRYYQHRRTFERGYRYY